ncbi:MAG: alanine racemase [Clostridia bacterium]|nr:alanine racemase [Clostridia bacterium]
MNNNLERAIGRTWVEIDLDNLAYNARLVREKTSENAEVMGIVKADAYGHGAVECAKILLNNGISRLGVSMLDEAIQLRNNGIKAPILILSDVESERCDELVLNDITAAVFTKEYAERLSRCAKMFNKKVKIHIKLDTGMGRVGFNPENDIDVIEYISKLPFVEIEGAFSHFAVSDEDTDEYTYIQFKRFCSAIEKIESRGINVQIKHISNSAAILRFPDMHLNMVRAGIILYGLHPSSVTKALNIELKPVMTLKSRITLIKTLSEDSPISYGCTYTAKKGDKIATIPIGYADGFQRRLGNKAKVCINGIRANIIGRVCMDQCLADVSEIENISAGDVAIIFGGNITCDYKENISCDEISELSETINYETVCLIGKRVPRVYIENGQYTGVTNGLI